MKEEAGSIQLSSIVMILTERGILAWRLSCFDSEKLEKIVEDSTGLLFKDRIAELLLQLKNIEYAKIPLNI